MTTDREKRRFKARVGAKRRCRVLAETRRRRTELCSSCPAPTSVAPPTNRDKVRAHDLTEFARLTSLHLASMRRASCGYKHAPETEGQSDWLRPSVSFSRSSDRGKL